MKLCDKKYANQNGKMTKMLQEGERGWWVKDKRALLVDSRSKSGFHVIHSNLVNADTNQNTAGLPLLLVV